MLSSMPKTYRVAPDFTLLDDQGNPVTLSSFRGKTVVLYFYPKDDTTGCTQEACEFKSRMPKFRNLNAVVLGVSPDSVKSHAKFKAKHMLNYPLLADLDHAVCETWGLWIQKRLYGHYYMGVDRTTYIIDARGRIVREFLKVNPEGHAAEVAAALADRTARTAGSRRLRALLVALLAMQFSLTPRPMLAQAVEAPAAEPSRWGVLLLGAQMNVITQHLTPLHSPYDGVNSLQPGGDTKTSYAYGTYVGAKLGSSLSAYVDIEMIRGEGVSRVIGLGGPTNGDVIRQGSADLGDGPYVARAFVRYVRGAGAAMDTLARAQDQVPLVVASRRFEVWAGLMAVTDLFDLNRYANSTRRQFMNWALFQNTAWDFAADTRGYSNGVAVAVLTPTWAVRAGAFQMPTRANGNVFDSDLSRAYGTQLEFTFARPRTGTVIRTLAWLNVARMGNYRAAIAQGLATSTMPDIVADDRPGRTKYGVGVNIEQPLADSGETGLFFRGGWSDGRNESFAFTEVDRHLSLGVQLSGARWGRTDDRLGVAVVNHGLADAHRDYLAAGGAGFLLGDGRLRYADERIVEVYYRAGFGGFIELGPDVQLIQNPGFNSDRGPAAVLSLRLNLRH